MAISANFIPAASVATHWQRFSEGCAEAGVEPDGERWHVARTILVTETDAEAKAYLARPDYAVRYYFYYLSALMKKAGFSQIMKGLEQFDDDKLTVDWAIDNIVIAGSPETVAREAARGARADRAVRHDRADRARLGRQGALAALDGADGERGHAGAAPGDRRRDRRQVAPGSAERQRGGDRPGQSARAAAGAGRGEHARRPVPRPGADRPRRASRSSKATAG